MRYYQDKDGCIKGLIDYKFYCFNGKPKNLYVSQGMEDHTTAKISFVTLDWEQVPFKRIDFGQFDKLPPKPKHLDLMLDISEILAKDYPFVRIDMYEINERVYFSEMTFYPCSGFMQIEPREYDEVLGRYLKL